MSAVRRIAAVAALAAIFPRMAWACSVCLGDPSSEQIQGMNMAILSLMGVTATVLGGVAFFAAMLWRRAALLERESEALGSTPSKPGDPNIG